MTDLEIAREQKAKLYQRLKEAKSDYMNATTHKERSLQRERSRMLKEMYREACDEVRRLDPEKVQTAQRKGKNGKKPATTVDSALACGAIWSDLEGVSWSQIEGRSWNSFSSESSGRQIRQVQDLINTAIKMCTPLQVQYIQAYYVEELTLEEIGERFGVDFTTVSRTLKRGRQRIEQYVTAKLLLNRCLDDNGYFDYMKFLNSAGIMTERQKEMVFLALAQDTSYRDIARYIDRTPSTVSRSVDRVEEKLSAISVTLNAGWSAVKVERKDWAERSEKQLAEDLGLAPYFYYRVMRRGERVNGIPLLYCAILNRLAAGDSVVTVSKRLGCSQPLVKRVRRKYNGISVPEFKEDYHPKTQSKEKLPENPFIALSTQDGNAIIDRIDAKTYAEIQKRFGTVKAC